MGIRVLSTDTAKSTVQKLQGIINGDLTHQVEAVKREGEVLTHADVWDGKLAVDFRHTWERTRQVLTNMLKELEELRHEVQIINQDIMTAGGNG